MQIIEAIPGYYAVVISTESHPGPNKGFRRVAHLKPVIAWAIEGEVPTPVGVGGPIGGVSAYLLPDGHVYGKDAGRKSSSLSTLVDFLTMEDAFLWDGKDVIDIRNQVGAARQQ